MKKNQPSPAEAQTPSPAEAQTPSPAEAQNPEQNHTQPSQDQPGAVASQATPSPQDTPPPAAETQNVSLSSEEEATHGISPVPIAAKLEEIYDASPVQQTATVEEVKAAPENAYDVPPASHAAQLREVYDASPVQQTATVKEVKAAPESVYDVPPSVRPVSPSDTYDVLPSPRPVPPSDTYDVLPSPRPVPPSDTYDVLPSPRPVPPSDTYDVLPSPRPVSPSDTYDVPPSSKDSPYAIYDKPSTPPPPVPPHTTATYDVPFSRNPFSIYDKPSKAHTWPRSKGRKQHDIYDTPSQPGESRLRADEQGNVHGVTRSSSLLAAGEQTGQGTPAPEPIYAEIPDLPGSANVMPEEPVYTTIPEMLEQLGQKPEPIYETIPDLPESVSREPALTPEQLRSLYATVVPRSARPQVPPHQKSTEQTAAGKQQRLPQEDVPPALPPHPDLTEQHIAQDGTQKPEQVVRPKVTPPPVSPRPDLAEQRTASEPSLDPEYVLDINPKIPRPKVSRSKAAPPPVSPRPESTKQDPTTKKPEDSSKQVVRPKAFRPPLPPRPEHTKQKPKEARRSEVLYADISHPESSPARGSMSSNVSFSSGPGDDDPDREYGHVYATVLSKEQKEARNKNQNASSRSRGESTSSESSSGLSQGSRSERSSLSRSQANMVCAAYRREIMHWSQVVFGKESILNQAVEDIQRNPNAAEHVAMQLSQNPRTFHKFVGINFCGIKNKPRKDAEAGLFFLIQAVTGYANAEKHLQNINEKFIDFEKEVKPLTQKEIVGKVQRDPDVQYMANEVRFWSQKVFGDARRMDYHMEDIQRIPGMAEQTSWQLTTECKIFGNLPGHQFCGIKTSARRNAIAALPRLAKAIENYGESVQGARENIIKSHEEEIERYRGFVERSQKLAQQKDGPEVSKQQAGKAVSFPLQQKSTQTAQRMSFGM